MAKAAQLGLAALVLVLGTVCLAASARSARSQPRAAVLESAILPPRAFRHWFYQTTRVTSGPQNEIPLDRLAGRYATYIHTYIHIYLYIYTYIYIYIYTIVYNRWTGVQIGRGMK